MALSKARNNLHLIALTMVICTITATYAAHVPDNRQNLQVLRNIEKSLNTTANPCDNFYNYACGNWAKHFVNDEVTEIITLLNQQFETAIEDVIGRHYPTAKDLPKHNQNPLEKAVAYYYSCQKMAKFNPVIYLRAVSPDKDLKWPLHLELMQLIGEGHSNFTQQPAFKDFNIFALLGQLKSYGLPNTLAYFMADFKDERAIGLLTPAQKYLTAEEVKRILNYFGFTDELIQRYSDEILGIDSYWQAAYAKYASYEDVRNFTYREVQHYYPQLATVLENMYGDVLRSEDMLGFASLSYVEFLLGHRWQPYEIEQMCNYLLVKFILYVEDMHETKCSIRLRRQMSLAVNYMYYQHIYVAETEQFNANITRLTSLIFKQMLRTLNVNRLHFTNDQLKAIKQKIIDMVTNVGNLPANISLTQIEEFYRDVPDLSINNFYDNDALLLKHRFRESLQCTSSIACDHTMDSSPTNYYLQNLVVVPFSALQLPFYHHNLHPIFGMSAFGFIMGHEFTHAIDPVSLQADKARFSVLFDYIAPDAQFYESIECMQEQHPTDYINERTADLVGSRLAYEAYERQFHVQPPFTRIPWQQLFFLNMAQFFCGDNLAIIEDHDLDELRLNLIVKNLEGFSQAFQCPAGSEMNPTKKCRFF